VTNTDPVVATSQPTVVTASFAALSGVTFSSATGTGWDCSQSSGAQLSCTLSQVLAPKASGPTLVVTLAIAANTSGGTGLLLTATNASGKPTTSTDTINITVATRYSVGGTASGLTGAGFVLQDNGGDDLAIAVNGSFTFATPLIDRAAYRVTVKTQPSGQSCQLGNASGTIPGANVSNVTVTCVAPSGHFAFVGDFAQQAVNVYLIGSDGALAQVTGSPFTAADVHALAVTPSGTWLYAADYTPGTVTGFRVDGSTGALTALPGFPIMAGTQPDSAAIDPSGKFLYVANLGSSNISAFTINASTGALTSVTGSPFPLPGPGRSASVDPLGRFLYVTGTGVAAFRISASDGALTVVSGSPFPTGNAPAGIGFDPAGKFAYVANSASNTLSAFTIDASSGALTPIAGSPYTTNPGPVGIAVAPSGKLLYVSNGTANALAGFTIDANTGALTALFAGVATGQNPTQIGIDPSGKFLYVADQKTPNVAGDVSGYSIAAGGGLTPLAGSPFPAGNGASSLVIH
jgi:6-phosphogluconolactonase (cycloisomerase 2 family)